jgi:hypothetical protein
MVIEMGVESGGADFLCIEATSYVGYGVVFFITMIQYVLRLKSEITNRFMEFQ